MRFVLAIPFLAAVAAPAPAEDSPKFDFKKGAVFIGHAEATVVDIRPRATGEIERVPVGSGDRVQKGQVLVELDGRLQRAALNAAKARLAVAEAEARLVAVDLDRAKAAFIAKAVSKEELARAEIGLDKAKALIEVAKAEAATAEIQLHYTRLVAPISGRVSGLSATEGNLCLADGPALMSVIAADTVTAVFKVEERMLLEFLRLAAGDKAVVEVGLANEEGFPHKAVLEAIDARIDPATGSARLRATVANPKGLIPHGAFLRVRLTFPSGK